ncbi:SPFH domain-containing protein [Nocardia sp. NPDC059091]|uniref:SPFH domain-containing protein n=1 Tax=unclassified Nocardia TaxID=2637762 RepID=UPI00367B9203
MAWFEREFIAVPEQNKNQLVFKWPDVNIRRFSRVIINADEVAVFVRTGRVLATLGPGRHRIDAEELPVLGALIDTLTGGNYYRAELYFVSTKEFSRVKFGGRLSDVLDPVSAQVVTLRSFGEFALSVRDPAQLITAVTGTATPTDPAATPAWCAEQLLKVMKIAVTQGVSRGDWPILGLSAHLGDIEEAVLRPANLQLYEFGLRVPRLGNFDITVAPEDAERLKRLAKDTTYVRLAGDFQRYAAGELALGAGQGLARGVGDTGFLGAALGMNALHHHTAPPAAPAPIAAAAESVCAACGASHSPAARFCTHCGLDLQQVRRCGRCAAELPQHANFCGLCGAPAT